MAFERSEALEKIAQRRFVPFHYEHESQTFHFGDQTQSLGDIETHGMLHRAGADLDSKDAERLLSTVAFAGSFNRLHTLPLADVFFEKAWNTKLLHETNEVMFDAYIAARALHEGGDSRYRPNTNEFSTVLYDQVEDPSGHAGVFLQVAGICACTKPEHRADVSYHPVEIMSYVEHNVAKPFERAGLLAGLGHIARRANEYVR